MHTTIKVCGSAAACCGDPPCRGTRGVPWARDRGLSGWGLSRGGGGRASGCLPGGGWSGASRGGVMRGGVAAVGNFDGVHLGHQAVLRRATEEGRRRRGRVVAATFHPHPRAVLTPGVQPKLLTTRELRREALLRYGADEVWEIRFDEELSRKGPEEFVREVLVGEIGAEAVVVGENFRFGHGAAGDVGDLGRLMRRFGGKAYSVP